MTVYMITWNQAVLPPFVRCVESLPNLHTLEIGMANIFMTAPLKDALEGVKLPQIKTLILPPAAHPLLQHCHNAEDVICVIEYYTGSSDEFFESLASNQDSKVKRLAIPLLWGKQSRKQSNTTHNHWERMAADRL